MGLETGTYIDSLVATNPLGTDAKSQGDNHLRLIKATVKASFPNVAGAVAATHTELSYVSGVTSAIQTQLNLKATIVYVDAEIAALDAAKAEDSAVVKLTGAQAVGGAKSFSSVLAALAGIELGHASDTTLARIAAGRVSIEGGEIAKLNASEPFTVAQNIETTGAALLTRRIGAAVDEGRWSWESETNAMSIRTRADAGSIGHTSFRIARGSGNTSVSVQLYSEGVLQLATQDSASPPHTTGAEVRHADGSLYDVGMNVMPPLIVNSAVTLGRLYIGKTLIHDNSTPYTWTTPANTDVTVPIGSVINIINYGSGALTIAKGSGTNLYRYNGTGAPGTTNRTLSQGGVATLYRSSSVSWNIWGNGGLD